VIENVDSILTASITYRAPVAYTWNLRTGWLHHLKSNLEQRLDQGACTCFQFSTCFILYRFHSGRVFKGVWNQTPVALKVLKSEGCQAPSSTVSGEAPQHVIDSDPSRLYGEKSKFRVCSHIPLSISDTLYVDVGKNTPSTCSPCVLHMNVPSHPVALLISLIRISRGQYFG
jgi:hypothetical protein